jgi:hypothetical protein
VSLKKCNYSDIIESWTSHAMKFGRYQGQRNEPQTQIGSWSNFHVQTYLYRAIYRHQIKEKPASGHPTARESGRESRASTGKKCKWQRPARQSKAHRSKAESMQSTRTRNNRNVRSKKGRQKKQAAFRFPTVIGVGGRGDQDLPLGP